VSAVPQAHFDSTQRQYESATLGTWVFLATELMFFGPLFLAYAHGRVETGDAFAAASRHTDVVIGTVNTVILLTSSLCIALAVRSVMLAKQLSEGQGRDSTGIDGHTRTAARFLWLTALLGVVFLALKAVEYHAEWREHLVPWLDFRFAAKDRTGAGYFYFVYFAMTGLHAVHLIVGVSLVAMLAVRLQRGATERANIVAMTGLYWHFIDAIWVFLYPLLYLVGRHG
jgi:cytochrome c oxidase subunit 3